jgi:Recombination enhancement, RecA-dependent nuclease
VPGTEVTKAELIHKGKLAEIGCMICRMNGINDGPVELHHLRSGGWGKGDYKTLIPLCVEHHRGNTGIHGMGTKAFEREYGVTQTELLNKAKGLICLDQ